MHLIDKVSTNSNGSLAWITKKITNYKNKMLLTTVLPEHGNRDWFYRYSRSPQLIFPFNKLLNNMQGIERAKM